MMILSFTWQVRIYFVEFLDIVKYVLKMGITEPQNFVLGQTIVLYNEKDSRQRFIQEHEIADIVTAFAVGCGKR
jgi:hypothetical protein